MTLSTEKSFLLREKKLTLADKTVGVGYTENNVGVLTIDD